MTLFFDDHDELLFLEDGGGLPGGLNAGLSGSLGDGVDIVGSDSSDNAPKRRLGDPEVLFPVSLDSVSMLTLRETETPGETVTSAERETLRSAADCHISGLSTQKQKDEMQISITQSTI